ncbi:MAG: SusC/RagA family TonB-linked outer membrane protein [Bacteroidales bacterium]
MKKRFLYAAIFWAGIASTLPAQKVSVNVKQTKLENVFNTISKQTGYTFAYSTSIINPEIRVTIHSENENLKDVLQKLFNDENINFEIKDKKIYLKAKENTTPVKTDKTKTIKGNVTDQTGEAVIGANVVVPGTTIGTITDFDGNFVLDVPEDAKLKFSYIGLLDQLVDVKGKNQFNIQMKDNSKALEEVVVVGYGSEKKVNVIGSISQISGDKLTNRNTTQLSNALTGQMPGVTVIQRSGRPGNDAGQIRIRGVGSLGASDKANALILIDGVPGSLSDVSAEDIETISILKDASTAAIYGSRAANGVILVTTKSGNEGKIKISYSGSVSLSKATEMPQFVNSWEYATLFNEAKGRDAFSAEEIQKFKDGSDPDNYANENYLDNIFKKNGLQTTHELMINGGSDKNRFLISFGYLFQDGLVKKNNYERYNFRLNLTNELSKKFTLTTRVSARYTEIEEPATPGGVDLTDMMGIIQKSVRFPGLYPSQLSNGSWGVGPKLEGTGLAWINSESFYKNPNLRLNGNIRLDYDPIQDLKISAIGGLNFAHNESKRYRSTLDLSDGRKIGPSSLNHSMDNTIYKSVQLTADYSKKIKKNSFGALIGYSWEDSKYRNLSGSRDKFPGNDLPFLNAGSPDNQLASGGGYEWAIQSVFGRARYNYDEKYLFETTMRYDGSSRFPKNQKYGFFPSVAAGWRLSEESFIRDNTKFSWITNLKLKASWGKLGNQNIGNYPYQTVFALGQNYPFGDALNQGAAVTVLTDRNIKWEDTETYDIGFESLLWDGKLSANVSYFYRYTNDILYKPSGSVSSILGLQISERNTGKLKNTGFEFELGHRNSIGKVNYNIAANLSIINNKLVTLGVGNVEQLNGLVGNGSNLFIGYPLEIYYGYLTDGVFISDDDVTQWPNQSKITPNAKAGDIRYKDISGPDGVPDGIVDPNYDRVPLGSRIPKFNFGCNFSVDYKNFDLAIQLQGVAGVKGMLEEYAGWALWSEGNIQKWQADGRFNPENPQRYPAYPRIEDLGNTVGPNTQTSDFWILDASYVRVKNIQFGYNFPNSLLQKIQVSNLRLYISAENPFTWNKYREGWDPEINTAGSYYPILANYSLGVNIKF